MSDSVTVEITLRATPETVWRQLTDADALASWYWPPSFETVVDIDAVAGGAYRIASETAGMAVSGEFLEVHAPGRFVKTWRWDNEDEETRVELTLTPTEDGTLLRIEHSGFGTAEAVENHRLGWESCLARLPGALND